MHASKRINTRKVARGRVAYNVRPSRRMHAAQCAACIACERPRDGAWTREATHRTRVQRHYPRPVYIEGRLCYADTTREGRLRDTRGVCA